MGAWRERAWRAIAAIALLAFVVRTLIPVGFMPERQNGKLVLAICTGTTVAPAAAVSEIRAFLDFANAADHRPGGKQNHETRIEACPFATAGFGPHQLDKPLVAPVRLDFVAEFAPFLQSIAAAPALAASARGPPNRLSSAVSFELKV